MDGALNALQVELGSLRIRVDNAQNNPALYETLPDALRAAEGSFRNLSQAIGDAQQALSGLVGQHVESEQLDARGQAYREAGIKALRDPLLADPLRQLRSFWDEGLDLISGVCLRHGGLDGGLCRIADAVICRTGWPIPRVLSVPGRGGPGHHTSVVHLRFPEWTVWALPLAAHELWHLGWRSKSQDRGGATGGNDILDGILDILGRTSDEKWTHFADRAPQEANDAGLQLCLADVFGVYVMGPAYVCAAIWLVLDPADAIAKRRAKSMLRALTPEADYGEIRNVLTTQWEEATNGEQGTWREEDAEWVDAVLLFLQQSSVPKFYLKTWKAVRVKWSQALVAQNLASLDPKPRSTHLPYALSAAWKVRMDSPSEKHEAIAEAALKLCNDILELPREKDAAERMMYDPD